ncbi:hypothetical protein DSO57_1001525 [Entomophthora muscae]|uniref:Uncharacterized protein n=1 Tax=Entomophthora muscae TaxID=34485 RepID=A0ACC2RNX5_9FUNG|nr:hypothetical protein DSO57_1001525 [Entomophthora muscae]
MREPITYSAGCRDPNRSRALELLNKGPLEYLKSIESEDLGLWIGQAGLFNRVHAEMEELYGPPTKNHLNAIHKLTQKKYIVYGFRHMPAVKISQPISCFANEKCTLKTYYNDGRWISAYKRVYINPARKRATSKFIYPRYKAINNTYAITLFEPGFITLEFTPIVWGIWWRFPLFKGSMTYSRNYICGGMYFVPKVNGTPNGFIAPESSHSSMISFNLAPTSHLPINYITIFKYIVIL